jgi:type I restriction enzyme S subunit
LYYLLQSKYFFEKANSLARGAAQPDLPHSLFNSIEISYPELDCQHRIATILSRYDSLIENYQKQIKLLEEAAQRLYKEWFVDLHFPGHENTKIVDGVPEGWEKKPIGDVVVYYDKQRKPLSSMQRMNMEKIYPYYGAAALMDYVDSYLFDGIYLLFGEDGTVITPDNFPVLQYVWGKFWVNNHAHVLRGKNGISTEFLYSMLKEMPIADVVTGAAQPKISQGRLSDKKILMPSLELVQKWSCITNHYFESIRLITEKIRLLTEARDRLLPKLMSGDFM